MRKHFFAIILFITLFSFATLSNAEEDGFLNIPKHYYNIILICVDTLRADHLGCYGYFRDTSPNIDNFAKGGILFEQAISQATDSLASHASIFTSQYAAVHGVCFFNKPTDIGITLPEILKMRGYETAAFTGRGNVRAAFGLSEGFDIFNDLSLENKWSRPFKEVLPLAIQWLKDKKNKNFFLFLHTYDVHEPYHSICENIFDPNYTGIVDSINLIGLWYKIQQGLCLTDDGRMEKLTLEDVNHIIAHYDGGIRCLDEKIGEFMKEIRKLGILDSTVIILLSDHGEELGEHGAISRHVRSYYDEIIRVPFIIKHPKIKSPMRIRTQVQLIDLMPTLLDFLGIPINTEAQGNSLVPLIEGRASNSFNEYVYSETGVIRSLGWKLIMEKRELYNLKEDPGELNNLAEKYPKIFLRMSKKLADWIHKCQDGISAKRLHYGDEPKIIKKKHRNRKEIEDIGYW